MHQWSRPTPDLALAGISRSPWLSARVLAPLLTFVVLGFFGILLYSGPARLSSLVDLQQIIVFECLLIAVVAVAPLLVRKLSRQALDPLEPGAIFVMVYVIVFCVRPLFVRSEWVSYMERTVMEVFWFFSLQDSEVALTLFYGLVGLVCFHLGYRTWQDPLAVALPDHRVRPWSSRRVTRVAWAGIAFAVLSFFLVIPVISQVDTVLDQFGRFRDLLLGHGYQGLGMDLLVILVLILWVDHLVGHRRGLVIPLLIISNVYNLFLGSRAGIFNLWIFLYLAHRYLREKKFDWRRSLAGVFVATAAVFSALSIALLRNEGIRYWGDAARSLKDYWLYTPLGVILANLLLEFNQFDIFAMVVGFGSRQFPFLWGQSYLEMFYQPIPRALWPAKPWPFDVHIGELITGTRTGIPPGIVGELYLNFHIVGIILGMFLFGVLCRVGYQRALARPRDPGKVLLYALLLPYLPIMMLRSFVGGGTTVLVYLVPTWLALRYIQGQRVAS